MKALLRLAASAFLALAAGACASAGVDMPDPNLVRSPEPMAGSEGAFLSPYTAEGNLTSWAQRAVDSGVLGDVEGYMGIDRGNLIESAFSAGKRLIGSEATVNDATLEAAGGWEVIRAATEQSFATAEDLSTHLYANYHDDAMFSKALAVSADLYPQVRTGFVKAVQASVVQVIDEAPEAAEAAADKALDQANETLETELDTKLDETNAELEEALDDATGDSNR